MKNRLRVLLIVSFIAVVLTACKGGGGGAPNDSTGNTNGDATNTVVQTNVVLMDNETISSSTSTVSSNGTVITFNSSATTSQIIVGNVIVSDANSAFPNGALFKVATVSQTGDQLIVTTAPATLEDVIQSTDIQVTKSLSTTDIASAMSQLKGVSFDRNGAIRSASIGAFSLSLNNVVLYDEDGNLNTTDDQVVANGSISLEPSFDFSLSMQSSKVSKIAFTLSANETAEISVQTQATLSAKKEVEIGKYQFTPITVWAGWVPIVITPVLTVHVSVDGSISYGISASVTQDATLTAGLSYDNGSWTPSNTFSNSFQFNKPTGSLAATAKVEAGPQLDLLIYGITGPYVNVNAYLELDVTPTSDPLMALYGGLSGDVGVKFDILSNVVAEYSATVIDYRKLLSQYSVGSVSSTW